MLADNGEDVPTKQQSWNHHGLLHTCPSWPLSGQCRRHKWRGRMCRWRSTPRYFKWIHTMADDGPTRTITTV